MNQDPRALIDAFKERNPELFDLLQGVKKEHAERVRERVRERRKALNNGPDYALWERAMFGAYPSTVSEEEKKKITLEQWGLKK